MSWPIVCGGLDSPPGLWIVGSMDGATADLLLEIERQAVSAQGSWKISERYCGQVIFTSSRGSTTRAAGPGSPRF